jgi:hypothetical protein
LVNTVLPNNKVRIAVLILEHTFGDNLLGVMQACCFLIVFEEVKEYFYECEKLIPFVEISVLGLGISFPIASRSMLHNHDGGRVHGIFGMFL